MRETRALARGIASMSFLVAATLGAQVTVTRAEIAVGSEAERYLRALTLTSGSGLGWIVRPSAGERAARELAGAPGPWRLDTARVGAAPPVGSWRRPGSAIIATFNAGLPTVDADGPAWSGRGMNLRASATAMVERERWTVRIAPVAWFAANRPFALAPTTGPFPFSDPATPITIDLPQRHGTESLARLDAGESELEVRLRGARLALTSRAARIGPGSDHALILQGDAGGVPRVEAATIDGVGTRIGRLGFQVAWGRAPQTAWAPERGTGALFTSHMLATWQPWFSDRLELGMLRLNHRAWDRITWREAFVPFGSVYSAVGGEYDTSLDNQLASLFARYVLPGAGLEFFAEYGKNDRSRDWRDQMLELEHNAAWLAGAQRAWLDARGRLWALNVTAVSGGIAPIARVRGQAFFYEHEPLRQGHTLRGQLLGTPLLQREGGVELRLDRWDARGRTGIALRTRALPNELAETVAPENARQEWSLAVDALRETRRGRWTARVAGLADLGHSPVTGDAYNLQLMLGWSPR